MPFARKRNSNPCRLEGGVPEIKRRSPRGSNSRAAEGFRNAGILPAGFDVAVRAQKQIQKRGRDPPRGTAAGRRPRYEPRPFARTRSILPRAAIRIETCEQRTQIPRVARARQLVFDGYQARVEAFVPSSHVAARIFLRKILAFAVGTLQLKHLRALDSRSARREAHSIHKLAHGAACPMQRRRKINAYAAARFVPREAPSARNSAAVAHFPSQFCE
jgi:hypothetical protein